MKAGSFAVLAPLLLLATASLAVAQQSAVAPQPPPRTAAAPAALSVPNPLAGLHPGPRDLYRSPDGSDRFQHRQSVSRSAAASSFPESYFPGPYYYAVRLPVRTTRRPGGDVQTVDGRDYLRRQREPRAAAWCCETMPDMAQVFVDGFYVGLAEEFGLRGRAIDLSAGRTTSSCARRVTKR